MTAPASLARYEERAFGLWLFLMSDVIVFALLFATFAVLSRGTAGGPTGRELFSLSSAFTGTLLLLFSSTAFGFASLAARSANRRATALWLLLAAVLGAGFVGLEFRELSGLVARGAGPDRSGFLSAFFTLVGAHALHVVAGLIGLLVILGQLAFKGPTPPGLSRLLRLGLFWHFLDIIWVAIFSVVYLPALL